MISHGVSDMTRSTGRVSVDVDHDTATFTVETLRRRWTRIGHTAYPQARRLLITADGGGSDSNRNRLWKLEVQRFAGDIGLKVSVCHFPPATSKWNKIEHRMVCHITGIWRGHPLISHETVVNLIGHTTTKRRLTISAELDKSTCPLGQQGTSAQLESLALKRDGFHGEWNYSLSSRAK